MATFLLGLGVAFAIEGLLYAAIPAAMQTMMRRVVELPQSSLRTFGVVSLAGGVLLVWLSGG